MRVKDMFNKIADFGSRNSAGILTGLSLVGLGVTIYQAYKAGVTADDLIKKRKEEFRDCETKEEKKEVAKQAVKEIAPLLFPTAISGATTAACILGGQSINKKKIALVSSAYSISEKALKELNDKMKETLGEKKKKEVRDAVLKEKLDKNGSDPSSQIIVPGDGNVLCYDSWTDRYFPSNAQKIGLAINEWSSQIRREVYSELNDFYYLLGLRPTKSGTDYGYTDRDLIDGNLPITYTAMLTESQQPCLCIDYEGLHLIDREHRFQ